jgi:hypothetical protein
MRVQPNNSVRTTVKKLTQVGMITSGTYFAVNKSVDFYLMATNSSYTARPYGSFEDCARVFALGVFTACYIINRSI